MGEQADCDQVCTCEGREGRKKLERKSLRIQKVLRPAGLVGSVPAEVLHSRDPMSGRVYQHSHPGTSAAFSHCLPRGLGLSLSDAMVPNLWQLGLSLC